MLSDEVQSIKALLHLVSTVFGGHCACNHCWSTEGTKTILSKMYWCGGWWTTIGLYRCSLLSRRMAKPFLSFVNEDCLPLCSKIFMFHYVPTIPLQFHYVPMPSNNFNFHYVMTIRLHSKGSTTLQQFYHIPTIPLRFEQFQYVATFSFHYVFNFQFN